MAAVIEVRARGGGWWPPRESEVVPQAPDDKTEQERLSLAVAMEVVKHLIASGQVYAELEAGVQLWTRLHSQARPVSSWGVL